MKSDEYAKENAEQLKAYCEAHKNDCEPCIFFQESDKYFMSSCMLRSKTPSEWLNEKPI